MHNPGFFAQSEKAERVITRDYDLWYSFDPVAMGEENAADFLAATRDPAVVRGMLADYRAGLEYDFYDDQQDDRFGRRLTCPLAVLWSSKDDMESLYGNPIEPWRQWTSSEIFGQGSKAPTISPKKHRRRWPLPWFSS